MLEPEETVTLMLGVPTAFDVLSPTRSRGLQRMSIRGAPIINRVIDCTPLEPAAVVGMTSSLMLAGFVDTQLASVAVWKLLTILLRL